MDDIINLYTNGNSINKISKILGISAYHITKVLKENNIEIRSGNYQNIDIDVNRINELYASGMSTYSIADSIGCSDETVRKHIKNIRSASERNKLKPNSISKIRQKSIDNWKNQEYVDKVKAATSSDSYKRALAEHGKKNYDITIGSWIKTEEETQ